jgi:uncharacterized protein involved in exopolysaccharide biosynthesis
LVITPGSPQLTSQQPTEVTETQVNSEIELIKSHDILENVIRAAKYELPSATTPPGRYSAISLAHALLKFQKSLSVGPIRKTNIIEVKLTASDPDKAVVMLEDLGNRYLAAHLAAHSSPGTGRFFNEQVKNYARQLVEARMAISDFHRKNGLFSLPEQRTNMLQSLQAVQSRLGELDAEIATQKARLAEANRQLASSPDRVLTQERSVPNQMAVQQLQATLTELRNRRRSRHEV